LVRKPEGKRPVGRHSHKWKDKIKMDLREIGWEGVDWIYLGRDWWRALAKMVMNVWLP
jgi:hypothetical protein